MPNYSASRFPNYAKRTRKAVLTRNKLIKALGPEVRELVEKKQERHGFRWAARNALTDLKITDPSIRRNVINISEVITNQENLRKGIETNKPFLINEKASTPNFQNAYVEALFMLKKTSSVQELYLVKLLGNVSNANEFLKRLYQHQRNLNTAWEKQEEFIKAEQRAKH